MKKSIMVLFLILFAVFVVMSGCADNGNGTTAPSAAATNTPVDTGTYTQTFTPTQTPTPTATFITVSFQQGINSYAGSIDSKLSSPNPTFNYGGLDTMIMGNISSGVERGIVKFDISSIPAGVTITAAALTLKFNNCVGTDTLQIYKAAKAWTEGISTGAGSTADVSWNNATTSDPWTSAGGDYTGLMGEFPFSSANYGTGDSIEISLEVSVVQSWLDTPAGNYGMILKTAAEAVGKFSVFYTKETSIAGDRPILSVSYTQ